MTARGDCIIAVGADKGALHFPPEFRRVAASDSTRVAIVLSCGGATDLVEAWGSSALMFSSPDSIVVRRSSFVDARTVAVRSDKAAADLSRDLVDQLKHAAPLEAYFIAFTIDEEDEVKAELRTLFNLRRV